MRIGFQTAFLAVLIGVAVAYFALPARAQGPDDCRGGGLTYSLKGSSAALTKPVSACG